MGRYPFIISFWPTIYEHERKLCPGAASIGHRINSAKHARVVVGVVRGHVVFSDVVKGEEAVCVCLQQQQVVIRQPRLLEAKRWSTTATTKFENDRELQTSIWLKYKMADRQHMSTMSCSVCTQFQSKLRGMRNFNIEGSKNLRTSSLKELAASDIHSRAILLLKWKQSTNTLDYAPIAKALHTMDASAEQQV